jgi:hypothetical protein
MKKSKKPVSKKSKTKAAKPIVSKKKKSSDGFLAGFLGAKAAGASDEDALLFGIIMDDDEN